MKSLIPALGGLLTILATLLAGSGCTTKSKARQQAQAAFAAGQAQAAAAAREAQRPIVTVRGEVLHHEIPWSEDLTLARALVAAEYRGLRDPRSIKVTRGTERLTISTRDLLAGRADPPLLPGDVIDVLR